MYGKDLPVDIKSATSGNFQKLLLALLTPLDEYLAQLLHEAIDGLGTDEDVLIELLCTSSNFVIKTIRSVYEKCEYMTLGGGQRMIFNSICSVQS
jgi:annexin A7/11